MCSYILASSKIYIWNTLHLPDTGESKHGPYTTSSYLIVRNKQRISSKSQIEINFVNKILEEEKPTSIGVFREGLSEEVALS